jgi:hypothetical protein
MQVLKNRNGWREKFCVVGEEPVLEVKENNFGMTLIEASKALPVESLKFNRQYQRATEPARKERVKKSIITCGHFLPDQSITVNQDYEVVDGQHRLLAALELEMTHIPATIYHFADKQKEAAFFVHINGFVQALSPLDYWYGRFLARCPIANFMYFLESDQQSKLMGQIIVKGSDSKKSRIPPTLALEIIIKAIGSYSNWSRRSDDILVKKMISTGTKTALFNVNNFVGWYQEIFGKKKENPDAYRNDSFRAISFLYDRLFREGVAHQRYTMQKLKSFPMNTAFITAPLNGKKYQLIDHINRGRKKNRIPYSLEN